MGAMRLDFTDDNGIMTFNLKGTETQAEVAITLQDTDHGVDTRTIITHEDGRVEVMSDKTDRGTPPLQLMLEAFQTIQHTFLHNAQAAFNKSRYERLKAEGKPINMQTMCMDGMHTDDKWAEVPFSGGIVGVPEHHENDPAPAVQEPELPTTLSSQLMSDLGDIFGDDKGGDDDAQG